MTQYDQEILKDLLRQYHELDISQAAIGDSASIGETSRHFCLGKSSAYRNAAMMLIEVMRKLGIDQ